MEGWKGVVGWIWGTIFNLFLGYIFRNSILEALKKCRAKRKRMLEALQNKFRCLGRPGFFPVVFQWFSVVFRHDAKMKSYEIPEERMHTIFGIFGRGEFEWNLRVPAWCQRRTWNWRQIHQLYSEMPWFCIYMHWWDQPLFSNSRRKTCESDSFWKRSKILRSKSSERNLSKLYRLYRPHLESLGCGQHAAASSQLSISRQKILDDLKSWNVENAHL